MNELKITVLITKVQQELDDRDTLTAKGQGSFQWFNGKTNETDTMSFYARGGQALKLKENQKFLIWGTPQIRTSTSESGGKNQKLHLLVRGIVPLEASLEASSVVVEEQSAEVPAAVENFDLPF